VDTSDSRENCNAIISTSDNTLILGCKNITIPSSVTSIGYRTFYDCRGLTSITIPSSVTSIGESAFSGCTLVVFCNRETPPSASDAFDYRGFAIVPAEYAQNYRNASGWSNLIINGAIGVEKTTQTTVTLFTHDLFSDYSVIYGDVTQDLSPIDNKIVITGLTPNTSYTFLAKAKHKDIVLENKVMATTKTIDISGKSTDVTNLKATLIGSFDAGDATVTEHGFMVDGEYKDEITLTGLQPGKEYSGVYYVKCGDDCTFSKSIYVKTVPVEAGIYVQNSTATSCTFTGSYSVIDATVTGYGFTDKPDATEVTMTGLDPNTSYSNAFYVETKEGGRVTKSINFRTGSLTLTTLQPKVATPGNVIVAAESNIDNDEESVGFEWRRTDWTDDFKSNEGAAFLYEGTMEGYIRNLNTEKLWKYRPYYESKSGTRYYGEWMGLDPTNTSYFEPTVHTYATVGVTGNEAEVRGYAMRGSDNTAQQGFRYWPQASEARAVKAGGAVSVPGDALTVTATGTVMTATLKGLRYGTDYCVVAFVTTSEGETFYGERQTFRTGIDTSGIETAVSPAAPATEAARYDLQGHRLATPRRGLNIIRMSDGTVRKVVVK